jgi:hypothetical protein
LRRPRLYQSCSAIEEEEEKSNATFLSTSNQGINMNAEGKTNGYRSYRRVNTLENVPYSVLTIASPMLKF